MPSSTVENYLKAILLRSEKADAVVPMGALAEALGVVPGTVTTMVKAIMEQGLLEHLPRQGVRLTESGRKVALNVLRKHRLIETFLVTTLKMDWTEVHVEAEQLEHTLSNRVLERIDAFLDHPKTDPHGDPIPSAQGKLDTRVYDPLTAAAVQATLRIVRISDQSAQFLQFAEQEGLMPGTALKIMSRAESAGILTVRLKSGKTVVLGFEPAAKILVERTA